MVFPERVNVVKKIRNEQITQDAKGKIAVLCLGLVLSCLYGFRKRLSKCSCMFLNLSLQVLSADHIFKQL